MVARLVTDLPLLVVLAGPTASGKTALAIELAERLNGEIVSCDSVSVYQGMDIGSAKPSREERARIPHHMLDVVTPATEYTAGQYGRDARTAIGSIASRGKTPIVAGGTGLYLRALLEGLSPVPQRDEALRDRLRRSHQRLAAGHLHRLLARIDPSAAARIHANDTPKLIRAIEVSLLEKQPMSQAWSDRAAEPLTGFRIVELGLNPPRAALYDRINARCAQMFAAGLVEETGSLARRYGHNCRALTSLGYAQALAELDGTLTRTQAVAAAQQGHRNYAKRQLTWFRKRAEMQWIEAFGDASLDRALELVGI